MKRTSAIERFVADVWREKKEPVKNEKDEKEEKMENRMGRIIQVMNNDRTIQVTGKAKIAVKPDTVRLTMGLKGTEESYEGALEQSSQQAEALKICLEKLGFERTDVKTVSFEVNTKYESYQDDSRIWKQKFVGYEFRHDLKIEFDLNHELLGKMLYAVAHSSAEPEIGIFYMVKDAESAKNLLLEKAVRDAAEKAKVLTAAAGVKLYKVASIDYSWEDTEIISRPANRMMAAYTSKLAECADESYKMEMEPDDINVSDYVTVCWYISE